ncbi:MAG: DUF2835 domain-containing protein [Gammaproteobacteria bacterium]|nr:DUF2835 domain-containing protein [Gammaproteobacteria bacterium]MBT8150539.1 DUF2835 domain-containing protein [Gammaproteobacteria bacterium]NND39277.1 DUF2835 domain-containing protein [Pseudomonadales bacterium]NNL10540.1 DUF2835 domain-containing protein [Pseudomonadales bacterium]RZV60028.1 MAG: DUF2835 family protein [Pseudomonadales bacterium]
MLHDSEVCSELSHLNNPQGPGYSIIDVDIAISSAELMKLYRGSARQVVAEARDGRVVRFPALSLQPFISRDGVRGRFRLMINANNKLMHIDKLA